MSEQTPIEQPKEEVIAQTGQVEQQPEQKIEQSVEQQTESAQQSEEEAKAAVRAGYNKQPKHIEKEEQKEESAPAQAMPTTIAGIPEDELTAKLKKVDDLENVLNDRVRKLNNMVGNLKQRLDAIPKDTPKSEVRAITAESMKKMRELGFDEIAQALAEDLNGSFSVQSSPQVDVQEVVTKKMRETAEQELDDLHPDWRDVTAYNESGAYLHPGFSAWFQTLSTEMQDKVKTSNSVVFAARVLDTYKEWEKDKASKEAQARKASESRLQNAVTPTQGKAAATPSRMPDREGLWVGYNKGPKPLNKMR